MATDIKFLVSVDSKSAEVSIKRLDDEIGKLPKTTDKAAGPPGGFKNLWLQVGAGIAAVHGVMAGMRGFFGAIKDVTGAAMLNESMIAQLEARLKSTKGAAGLTKDELLKMASGLQGVTTYGDEAVVEAENLLLTFTKIGRHIFPEALGTVLDMSTALGQDLKSSSIQLGKALNDPIEGVTALRRVGVSFTEAQQDQIKVLVESGNVLDAQRLILKELQTEFGGASKAAANTFGGSLKQLTNYWGDLKEVLGTAITENESMRDLIGSLKDEIVILIETGKIADWANAASKAVSGFVWAFQEARDLITEFKPVPMQMAEGLSEWAMNMMGLKSAQQEMNEIQREATLRAIEFRKELKVLSPSMDEIREHFEKGKKHADEWMRSIKEADEKAFAFKETIKEMKDWWQKTNELWVEAHPVIKTTTTLIETGVHPALKNLVDIIKTLKEVQPTLKATFEEAIPPARDFGNIVLNDVPAALGIAKLASETATKEMKDHWDQLETGISTTFGNAVANAKSFEDAMNIIIDGILGSFRGMLGDMTSEFIKNNVFSKMSTAASNAATSVASSVGEVESSVREGISNLSGLATGLWTAAGAAVGTFLGSLFGGKGGLDSTDKWNLKEIWKNTKGAFDWLRINAQDKYDYWTRLFEETPEFLGEICGKHDTQIDLLRNIVNSFKGTVTAQYGFHGVLHTDTMIRAHAGEMVSIFPSSMTGSVSTVHNVSNISGPQRLIVQNTINIGGQRFDDMVVKSIEKAAKLGKLKLPAKTIQ